jgi:hypothetical protein
VSNEVAVRKYKWLVIVLVIHTIGLFVIGLLLTAFRLWELVRHSELNLAPEFDFLLSHIWLWLPVLIIPLLILIAFNTLAFYIFKWIDRRLNGKQWLAISILVVYLMGTMWLWGGSALLKGSANSSTSDKGIAYQNQIDALDVGGYNYTNYDIGGFVITTVGQPFAARGPNIMPKEKGEERSGGSDGMCCLGIPRHWHPGMEVAVTWDVDKLLDGKTPGKWYTALAKVPPYGPHTGGVIVHFLPGDRIRVQVFNASSGVLPRIDDNDPYIVQGVLDPELNKK